MSPQRLLLLAVLLWIAWRLVRSLIRDKITQAAENQLRKKSEQADETTVQDSFFQPDSRGHAHG